MKRKRCLSCVCKPVCSWVWAWARNTLHGERNACTRGHFSGLTGDRQFSLDMLRDLVRALLMTREGADCRRWARVFICFLLSGSAQNLLFPVKEPDLFCPIVPCWGDMVSIKATTVDRHRDCCLLPQTTAHVFLFPLHPKLSSDRTKRRKRQTGGKSPIHANRMDKKETKRVK